MPANTDCACHNLVFCRWPAAVRNIQCVLCDVTWLFDFDFQKSAGSAHSTPVKAPRTPSKGSATAPSTPRKDKSDGGGGDKNSTTPSAKTPTAGRNKVLPKEVMNWARASFTRCSWFRLLCICCLKRTVGIKSNRTAVGFIFWEMYEYIMQIYSFWQSKTSILIRL